MIHQIESAETETKRWEEIRRLENSRQQVRDWGLFSRTAKFAGLLLPVDIQEDTLHYVDALLVDRLVRLRTEAQ